VQGINDSGRIVGFYRDGFGNEIGFVKTGASYASIVGPPGNITEINGVSDLNEVVGKTRPPAAASMASSR
jgi:hypothetical protein